MPSLTSCDIGLGWLSPHFTEGDTEDQGPTGNEGLDLGHPHSKPQQAGAFLKKGKAAFQHHQHPLVAARRSRRLHRQIIWAKQDPLGLSLSAGSTWGELICGEVEEDEEVGFRTEIRLLNSVVPTPWASDRHTDMDPV